MPGPDDEPDDHVEAALSRLRSSLGDVRDAAARRDAYWAQVRREFQQRSLALDRARDVLRAQKENLAAAKRARSQRQIKSRDIYHA